MSLRGRGRIVEMTGCVENDPDMVEPADILVAANGSGEFAFGCVTGQIWGGGDTDAVAFSWDGNVEMDQVDANGWAELQPSGSIKGQIRFHGGDEANFIAHRGSSSTAC